MRFCSNKQDGFQIFAVTGVNTISFGISATAAARKGLLGFAVERLDPKENERYFMPGFKVFRAIIPQPDEKTQVSTFEHPVQSFVWDDFTAKDKRKYTYLFYPIRGVPKNLDRTADPIQIDVETEPLYSPTAEHQVFFNRGAASSQAYTRNFGYDRIEDLKEPKRTRALAWLSRDLDDAMLRFIDQVQPGDTLLACFYEFHYEPVVQALRQKAKQAKVRIIVDSKKNADDFPRSENAKAIANAGFPSACIKHREARTNAIQHNKFMIRLKGQGANAKPVEVWTGSTNLSMSGIHGQTNVGHWVRNPDVAESFRQYWELLAGDPGGRDEDDATTVRSKNAAFRQSVMALSDPPLTLDDLPQGTTAVFSPRKGLAVMDFYGELTDSAENSAALTLAFTVNKTFKERLIDNTSESHIVFLLLEKRDKANPKSKEPFVELKTKNNVYSAWGSFFPNPVYQWTRETNALRLGIATHVSYVHSKFLLRDPLGADPIVISGSANFSDASTKENDENMLWIRGDRRAADIYFTEFNRLWNHYYFRSVLEVLQAQGVTSTGDSLFLSENDTWTAKYKKGTLRSKRLALYTSMAVD